MRNCCVVLFLFIPALALPDRAACAQGYGPPQWAWRAVRGGPRRGDTLSLTVGDTATLHIEEAKCRFDVCFIIIGVAPDAGWTVDDTSIVTVARTPADSASPTVDIRARKVIVLGRRAGQTALRVKLPVPVLENMGTADSARTTIELPVVVVP
jgi:hypothetical protein